MMLSEQAQKWFPTHVQVTVLQAKDLKPKGKSGTNDTYTIIQLGKEKYSTSVAEKTLEPVWKEEASFELPGLLMQGNPEKYILFLIVMHRSLVGLDKFLGQVAINLNDIFEDKQRRKTDFHMNPTSSEDLRKIPDSDPFDATAGYRSLTYEEVLQELVKHKELLRRKDTHIRELEDYIDNLLVRVMEETPSILRVPYEPSRRAGKFSSSE